MEFGCSPYVCIGFLWLLQFSPMMHSLILKNIIHLINNKKEWCSLPRRIKIMQNIAVVFIRIGKYTDAITSLEHIMSESPNIKTGYNLILCYYALGDRERMKKAFQKLISVPLGIDEEDKYTPPNVSMQDATQNTLCCCRQGLYL